MKEKRGTQEFQVCDKCYRYQLSTFYYVGVCSMSQQDLCELVLVGEERRNLEYKGPMRWDNKLTKAKITKAALAIANIRDGGWVVIGVDQTNGNFKRIGLKDADAETFKHDDISIYINGYADPFVNLHVTNDVICENKRYVIIKIDEFEEFPVICKKEYPLAGLHEGKIYTRTRKRNENSEALTSSEMREIIDLAVDKNVRRFFERLKKVGAISGKQVTFDHKKAFENQLGDLE